VKKFGGKVGNSMKRDRQQDSSITELTRISRRLWVFLIVVFGLVMATGCSKQFAGLYLNKAKKLLAEAEKREARRLELQNYDDAKSEIDAAQGLMDEKKYKPAKERAARAREKAKKVLETSRSELAAQRLNQAKDERDVADRNNGVQEDPERYKKINEFYNKALEKQRKNKWDDVIRLCDEEMTEVRTLLNRLEGQAKQKRAAAQMKFEEMKNVGALEYASSYVITVQGMLQNIDKQINVDKDYQGARNSADDVIRKCEEGIIETKKKMAQTQISQIEDGLSDATNKGASLYARDLLESCNESFDTIVKEYFNQNYDKVLESAKLLQPKVEKLIYTTRMKSAENKIQTVVQEIGSLVEGGGRQYLPGRVETIESFLQNARNLFGQEKFEDAENECMTALSEVEKTQTAFNDLALDAMRNAAESHDISRNVFDKMTDIFIIRADMQLTGLDLQFEQNKEARKIELDSILKNAQLTLGIAKLSQEKGQYRKAIELAGEVKQSSEYVLNETYHAVAHNAIMELADQITKRETDGAREYAPVELDRTRNLLEKSKELLTQGDYKEAVKKASETRAQLALTTQELAQRAVENMNVARKEISEAPTYRTAEFQKSELDRAQSLLDQAEKALESQKLKPAVEIALEAASVAREASKKASRLWCEQILKDAETSIMKAEESGANNYAAEELDEAKRFLLSSQTLYKSENYMETKEVGQRSIQKAKDALFKKIITAETAINEAKSYNGWKYRYPLLSSAIVHAKKARQTIEKDEYDSANSYAERATLDAQEVVRDSKNAAFRERISNISSNVDKAIHTGVNYYQSGDIKDIYRRLADIQEEFSLEKYDYFSSKLDKLEADLERLINTTPEVLGKTIAQQQERLSRQKEAKAMDFAADLMDEAEQNLRYAKMDFDNKKFSQSYRDMTIAMNNLDEVDRRLNINSYADQAGTILENLDKAMVEFGRVLDLGPEMLKRFTKGPEGKGHYISIAGKMAPDVFRTVVTALYHETKQLQVPVGAENIHRDFVDMINDIRLASIYFEKLIILDQYEPKSQQEIIDKAFDLINQARKKRSALQETFLNREQKMRLAHLP